MLLRKDMVERDGIGLVRERELPIIYQSDEYNPLSVRLMTQAYRVTIIEVACKSVYLINIGLTRGKEKSEEVKSEK